MRETPLPATFAQLLRQARRAAGLTQEALAERTGLGTRTIQGLERGTQQPQRETLDRLMSGLTLSVEERRAFVQAAQPTPRRHPIMSGSPAPRPSASGHASGLPNHNLPFQLASFVGRERELADLTRRLGGGADGVRLLTLTGAGGCGKTRLALQVATEVVANYPDGVWLVELAPHRDPDLVAPSVAAALGIQCPPDRPILAHLVIALRSRQILLILDNCEHLLDACARLSDTLLRNCPKVRILATSREGLGIGGEMRWRVPSLTLPDFDMGATPVAASDSEAVQLFVERAGAVQLGFTLTEQTTPFVAQICRRLDGIPLAIELAAKRVVSLPLEQIAARLDQRFRLLTTGSRVALPRHQTLAALVDWSYDLLSDSERTLFNRLSVFAGGFTLEAIEEACRDTEDVASVLSSLVEKSLVIGHCGAGGVERYDMLETLRQYAAERLGTAGESSAVRTRHLAWYVALAERAEHHLFGPEQTQWLDRLEGEHDNLRAALAWSAEHDPEAGLRLAGSIWRFWQVRSHVVEGRRHLAALLERASAPTAARAKALLGAGVLARQQSDQVREKALLEESLTLYRWLGDKQGVSWALENLANTVSALEEALALAEEVGEPWRVGWVLRRLAGWAQVDGDVRRARALHEESLAAFRNAGEKRGVGDALIQLGDLALLDEDFHPAKARFAEALAVYRDIGSQRGISRALRGLGNVEHFEGNRQLAAAHYEESLAIVRGTGAERDLGDTLLWLGHVAAAEGDDRRARGHCREAMEIYRASGDDQEVSLCLRLFALVAMQQQAYACAIRLTAALPAFEQHSRETLILVHRTSADVDLAQARSVLGEEDFAMAWAEGQAMTLEQAVAYALEESQDA